MTTILGPPEHARTPQAADRESGSRALGHTRGPRVSPLASCASENKPHPMFWTLSSHKPSVNAGDTPAGQRRSRTQMLLAESRGMREGPGERLTQREGMIRILPLFVMVVLPWAPRGVLPRAPARITWRLSPCPALDSDGLPLTAPRKQDGHRALACVRAGLVSVPPTFLCDAEGSRWFHKRTRCPLSTRVLHRKGDRVLTWNTTWGQVFTTRIWSLGLRVQTC